MQKKKKWMAALLLLASVIWGSAYAAQSAGAQKVSAHTFNCLKLLSGAAALLPFVLITLLRGRGRTKERRKQLRVSLLGGLVCGASLLGASFAQQTALSTVSAGKAGFLTALYIVLVPVFGSFVGRRPEKKIWFCVFLDTVGFYFLCVHGTLTVEKGDLLLLVTASCFAVQILGTEWALSRGADGILLAFAQFLIAGLLELPVLLIKEAPAAADIVPALPEILFVGVISGALGNTLQNLGQKYIDSAPAALLMSPESVFAVLFGWAFLGQTLSGSELVGCACVFAAVILSQVDLKRGHRAQPHAEIGVH